MSKTLSETGVFIKDEPLQIITGSYPLLTWVLFKLTGVLIELTEVPFFHFTSLVFNVSYFQMRKEKSALDLLH